MSPMSDQFTLGYLQQFFRSFARPDLDRIIEEREAEARERSQRWWVRWVSGSAESSRACMSSSGTTSAAWSSAWTRPMSVSSATMREAYRS